MHGRPSLFVFFLRMKLALVATVVHLAASSNVPFSNRHGPNHADRHRTLPSVLAPTDAFASLLSTMKAADDAAAARSRRKVRHQPNKRHGQRSKVAAEQASAADPEDLAQQILSDPLRPRDAVIHQPNPVIINHDAQPTEQQHQGEALNGNLPAFEESCESRSVYNVILNTAAAEADDFERHYRKSERAPALVGLFVFALAGVFLLLLGEYMLMTAFGMVVLFVSFTAFLGMYDWAFAPEQGSEPTFTSCQLPLLLACVSAALTTCLALCLNRFFEEVMCFVFGACSAWVGMLALRSALLAVDPALASIEAFNWYWVGAIVVAIAWGLMAVRCRVTVILLATVTLGAYMFAVGTVGLLAIYDPNTREHLNGGIFFAFYVPAILVGALFQVVVLRRCGLDDPSENSSYK